jgi:hypothetical protein
MYIARVTDGKLKVLKHLGVIDPNERVLGTAQFAQARAV